MITTIIVLTLLSRFIKGKSIAQPAFLRKLIPQMHLNFIWRKLGLTVVASEQLPRIYKK